MSKAENAKSKFRSGIKKIGYKIFGHTVDISKLWLKMFIATGFIYGYNKSVIYCALHGEKVARATESRAVKMANLKKNIFLKPQNFDFPRKSSIS